MTAAWRCGGALLLVLMLGGTAAAACPPVKRKTSVIREFQRTTICPSTGTYGRCPGYVVDHKIPLCHTGPGGDRLSNLQYQTTAAAKQKDALERVLCRIQARPCAPMGD